MGCTTTKTKGTVRIQQLPDSPLTARPIQQYNQEEDDQEAIKILIMNQSFSKNNKQIYRVKSQNNSPRQNQQISDNLGLLQDLESHLNQKSQKRQTKLKKSAEKESRKSNTPDMPRPITYKNNGQQRIIIAEKPEMNDVEQIKIDNDFDLLFSNSSFSTSGKQKFRGIKTNSQLLSQLQFSKIQLNESSLQIVKEEITEEDFQTEELQQIQSDKYDCSTVYSKNALSRYSTLDKNDSKNTMLEMPTDFSYSRFSSISHYKNKEYRIQNSSEF
ncbi:UNKNOWN [Stylonychia lemnae]|uniref:Uncharacterized protein n=1 Tax=Stylonychia lemnae TaxID=5949 RepID=A0A077ZTJ6_STYLE|nr:UNKNOWN [Stylonychia lemnae]|eukprot:CDW72829.1 UNKNOWN [Stylonychia lemnae]